MREGGREGGRERNRKICLKEEGRRMPYLAIQSRLVLSLTMALHDSSYE